MNKINFTIAIPTYNSSKLVYKLLESIPNRSDIEIIIVDDYSSAIELDQTKKIFSQYSTSSNKLFFENKGVKSAGAARNIALENANGKWLIFADSDDYFTKNFDTILTRYVKSLSDIIYFKVDSNRLTTRAESLNRLLNKDDLDGIRYKHVVPWGKIIKKSLVDKFEIKFSEVVVSNDELFSAKVGLFSNTITIDDTIGYFSFEHDNSLTTQVHDIKLQNIRMNELLAKYVLLSSYLSKKKLRKTGLSIYFNIKNAIKIGGIMYAIGWYLQLRKSGGRLNLGAAALRRIRR